MAQRKSAKKDKAPKVADAKKQKRITRQARAGLCISSSRTRRLIERTWKGHISGDASVILASFLQFVCERIQTGAGESASKENPKTRITSSHIQAGLAKNKWLNKSGIIKGHVMGAAPMMLAAGGDSDNEDGEE